MKKFFALILICTLCLALCACGQQAQAPETDGGVNIVATVFPAYDFARQIAGDDGNVTLLIPPGSEAHSYEPTPQDIIRIQNCDLLVCNGGESEAWLDEILGGMGKEIPTVVMLDCVDALTEEVKDGMQVHEHHDHDHDEHEDEEYDEHVWLSLKNAQTLCSAISAVLQQIDPDNKDTYAANASAYIKKLSALDADYQAAVDAATRKTVLFGDRFPFRYLAEDYGLRYYAAFAGCSAESEASFETISFLAGKVDELNLPCVLTIEGVQHKIAETIVRNTAAKNQKVLTMDSMQSTTSKDAANGTTYLSVMERNLSVLKEALG